MLAPPKICTTTIYSRVQQITHSTCKDLEKVKTNPLHNTYLCDIPNTPKGLDTVLRRTASQGPLNGGNCTHPGNMFLLYIMFRPPRRMHYVQPHASFEGPRENEHNKSTLLKHIGLVSHTPWQKDISFQNHTSCSRLLYNLQHRLLHISTECRKANYQKP